MPSLPKKTKTVPVTGFDGVEIEVRTNPPVGIFLDSASTLQNAKDLSISETVLALYNLLSATVISWNITDEDGQEIPCDLDGLKTLPFDFLVAMADAVVEVVAALPPAPRPNSAAP